MQIEEQHVHIDLGNGGEEDTLDFNLFAPIVPGEKSSFQIFSTKMEVKLHKANPAVHWTSLVEDQTRPAVVSATSATEPAADGANPSSPAENDSSHGATRSDHTTSGPTVTAAGVSRPAVQQPNPADRPRFNKWNVPGSLDELDSDDDEQNGKDVESFFKQLYKDSNEDTRRAMAKSFLESNGTALSTNWEEVSKAPVPTKPPAGMEPKRYEQ